MILARPLERDDFNLRRVTRSGSIFEHGLFRKPGSLLGIILESRGVSQRQSGRLQNHVGAGWIPASPAISPQSICAWAARSGRDARGRSSAASERTRARGSTVRPRPRPSPFSFMLTCAGNCDPKAAPSSAAAGWSDASRRAIQPSFMMLEGSEARRYQPQM